MLFLLASALAVEGMWEPAQLVGQAEALRAAGFPGDPARLARLDQAPLGAVVTFGGCTGSFVSPDGLLVTNHHCVTGYLQQATRDGEELWRDGFYAPTRADERSAGPGASVYIPIEYRDVTPAIRDKVPASLDDAGRKLLMEDRIKKAVAACEKPGGRRCRVASYFEGLRYTLVVEQELKDVRLVMAPPDSVGNYGDDLDNWHWPRHSGDFAFVRAYVAPDGRAAPYAPDNVPYRPRHWLRVDPAGVGPGDFVMVAGYPGGTARWLTGTELELHATRGIPADIERAAWTLDLLQSTVKADPGTSNALMPVIGWVSNSLFNDRGVLDAFRRSGVVDQVKARDAALRVWVDADRARQAKYGPALDELDRRLRERAATFPRDHAMAWLGRSSLVSAANTLVRWAENQQKPDARRELGFQERDRERTWARLERMQRGIELGSERQFVRRMLLDVARLPPEQAVPELAAWLGPGDPEQRVDAAVERLFRSPELATVEGRRDAFHATPRELDAREDGFLSLARALWPFYERQREADRAHEGAMARLRPVYAEALRTFDPRHAYADANGTLRVTFGTVQGYSPRDAVSLGPQTTLEGIVEKAGDAPYNAPPKLLDAIRGGRRGPYLDPKLGSVPVNYISDLDITGGNSGSPTLNAEGRLVGLAFDGNVEGLASDYLFDAPRTRCIHADIRYVLYYLDAVTDADPLLRELGVTPAW